MTKKQLFDEVTKYFEAVRPVAESELHYLNPYQLIVAVILSAQCTDKRVNMTTPALFAAYPDVQSMAKATPEEVYKLIKSISYPNNKSKHLVGMAQAVVERFNGVIPNNIDDLQTLPGVGRKTANVVAAVAFGQPTMAVDTHVFRVSNRIGLTDNSKTPLQTELELTKHFPPEIIPKAHHWLILHGRYVCIARAPKCHECGLTKVCKYFKNKKKD
ncbi:MAG: endonuclease III [Bacteroidales bacterium]|nr:endonuclease III [Bacteroidales bacterium]